MNIDFLFWGKNEHFTVEVSFSCILPVRMQTNETC